MTTEEDKLMKRILSAFLAFMLTAALILTAAAEMENNIIRLPDGYEVHITTLTSLTDQSVEMDLIPVETYEGTQRKCGFVNREGEVVIAPVYGPLRMASLALPAWRMVSRNTAASIQRARS